MSTKSRFIKVKFEIPAVHSWPEVHFPEVDFLANMHHHNFIFEVVVEVVHHDRDIEFIMLQNDCKRFVEKSFVTYSMGILDFGRNSCESLGELLVNHIEDKYKSKLPRRVEVSVSEDGYYSGIVRNFI